MRRSGRPWMHLPARRCRPRMIRPEAGCAPAPYSQSTETPGNSKHRNTGSSPPVPRITPPVTYQVPSEATHGDSVPSPKVIGEQCRTRGSKTDLPIDTGINTAGRIISCCIKPQRLPPAARPVGLGPGFGLSTVDRERLGIGDAATGCGIEHRDRGRPFRSNVRCRYLRGQLGRGDIRRGAARSIPLNHRSVDKAAAVYRERKGRTSGCRLLTGSGSNAGTGLSTVLTVYRTSALEVEVPTRIFIAFPTVR